MWTRNCRFKFFNADYLSMGCVYQAPGGCIIATRCTVAIPVLRGARTDSTVWCYLCRGRSGIRFQSVDSWFTQALIHWRICSYDVASERETSGSEDAGINDGCSVYVGGPPQWRFVPSDCPPRNSEYSTDKAIKTYVFSPQQLWIEQNHNSNRRRTFMTLR